MNCLFESFLKMEVHVLDPHRPASECVESPGVTAGRLSFGVLLLCTTDGSIAATCWPCGCRGITELRTLVLPLQRGFTRQNPRLLATLLLCSVVLEAHVEKH